MAAPTTLGDGNATVNPDALNPVDPEGLESPAAADGISDAPEAGVATEEAVLPPATPDIRTAFADAVSLPTPPESPTPQASDAFVRFRRQLADMSALVPEVEEGSKGSVGRTDAMAAANITADTIPLAYDKTMSFTDTVRRPVSVAKVERAEDIERKDAMARKARAIMVALADILQALYRSEGSPFAAKHDSPIYTDEAGVQPDSYYQASRDVMHDALGHLRNTLGFRSGDSVEDMVYCLARVQYALTSLVRSEEEIATFSPADTEGGEAPMYVTREESTALQEFLQTALEGLIDSGAYRNMGIQCVVTPELFQQAVKDDYEFAIADQGFVNDVYASSNREITASQDQILQGAFGVSTLEILTANIPASSPEREIDRRVDDEVERVVRGVITAQPINVTVPVDRGNPNWKTGYGRRVLAAARRAISGDAALRTRKSKIIGADTWEPMDADKLKDEYIAGLIRDIDEMPADFVTKNPDVVRTQLSREMGGDVVVKTTVDPVIYLPLKTIQAVVDAYMRTQDGAPETRKLSADEVLISDSGFMQDTSEMAEATLRGLARLTADQPVPHVFVAGNVVHVNKRAIREALTHSEASHRHIQTMTIRRNIRALMMASVDQTARDMKMLPVDRVLSARKVEPTPDSPLDEVFSYVYQMSGVQDHMRSLGAEVNIDRMQRDRVFAQRALMEVYNRCVAPSVASRMSSVFDEKAGAVRADVEESKLALTKRVYGVPVSVDPRGKTGLEYVVEGTKDIDLSGLVANVTLAEMMPAASPVVPTTVEAVSDSLFDGSAFA